MCPIDAHATIKLEQDQVMASESMHKDSPTKQLTCAQNPLAAQLPMRTHNHHEHPPNPAKPNPYPTQLRSNQFGDRLTLSIRGFLLEVCLHVLC